MANRFGDSEAPSTPAAPRGVNRFGDREDVTPPPSVSKPPGQPQQPEPSLGQRVLQTGKEFVGSAAAGLMEPIVRGADVLWRAGGHPSALADPAVRKALTADPTIAGSIGYATGEAMPYFLPIGPEIEGAGLAKGALRAGREALKGGVISGAQTGTWKGAASGAVGGGLGGALGEVPQLAAGRLLRPGKRLTPEVAQALEATEKAGVPLSAGQRTGKVGLQKVERGLENLPGSERRATEFYIRQQEALAKRGRSLAERAAPTRANAYESGRGLQDRLRQRITRLKGHADSLYDSVRQETAAAKQTVQTGTRTSPVLGPSGQPIQTPIYSVLETPVDLAPMRRSLKPLYEDLTRAMPEARRANSPAYAALKDLMTSSESHMNAMDFDRSLSAIKALARDGDSPYLSTQSQRIAKAIITDGEKQLKTALGKVSPDIETRLTRARQAVRSYHDTAELLGDLHDEPAALYKNLISGGDRTLNTLQDLRRVAPREVQTVGRTFLEGLMEKATAEGGFRRAEGVMADWRTMGPETKRLLFGEQLTKDLDGFFLAAKKLAPHEGSATAGRLTALVPYGIATEVARSLLTGAPAHAAMELGAGVATAYVLPNIAARVLFAPGGARLLTKLASPVGGATAATARALVGLIDTAQRQESEDRGAAPARAGSPRASLERPGGIRQALTAAGERHGVPPVVMHAVAQIESSGRTGVVSPKGAMGLMQLMPATARQYGVRDLRDPLQNIEGSARLLSHLWRKYSGNIALVLAAYNAGEGAVDRAGGRVPDISETREYVRRGMNAMRRPAA